MPFDMPDNLVFAKPFRATALLKADGATEENGKLWLRGPIAPDDEGDDYDGDVLTKAGVDTGLEMFLKLGGGKTGQVDWGHMYRTSGKNPKYLIAKGHPYPGPTGRTWLADELFKKPLANEAWEHVHCGGHAGHSLDGLMKGRDPQDGKRIIKTEIHMITIDPQPKGFKNFLEVGPPESLQHIAKGILADMNRESLADAGWMPMPCELDPDLYATFFSDPDFAERTMKAVCFVPRFHAVGTLITKGDMMPPSDTPAPGGLHPDGMGIPDGGGMNCPDCGGQMACPDCGPGGMPTAQKSLMTGSAVVGDGATGGQTLRKQSLSPKVSQTAASVPQKRCSKCKRKNDARRACCKYCQAKF